MERKYEASDEQVVYERAYWYGYVVGRWARAEIEKEFLMTHAVNLERVDPLTGLLNKQAFEQMVIQSCERTRRLIEFERMHSLLFMDIDDFKQINATLGHPTADTMCLLPLAEIIRHSIRETDLAGRWGGEEFVVLLRDTGREAAQSIAERIRDHVNQIQPGTDLPSMGITIGIASYPQGMKYENVMDSANQAMLQAKLVPGKNTILFAEEPI